MSSLGGCGLCITCKTGYRSVEEEGGSWEDEKQLYLEGVRERRLMDSKGMGTRVCGMGMSPVVILQI